MRVTGSVIFIVQFLFIVQLLSMGAMEMSGPFGRFISKVWRRQSY